MAAQCDLDAAYLKMAGVWAGLSKALRKKVGCLIVKDGSIISDGYNGAVEITGWSCFHATRKYVPPTAFSYEVLEDIAK